MAIFMPAYDPDTCTQPRPRRIKASSGSIFELAELQKLVGGYIEALPLPDGRTLFFNEDGLSMGLLLNAAASSLATESIPCIEPIFIVGDAVLLDADEVK